MTDNKRKPLLPYLKPVNTINVVAMSVDGEQYTVEKRINTVVEEDKSFFLMYNYFFGLMNGIDSIVDVKVLLWIQENTSYNENVITLNKYWKDKIKVHTGYSLSAIERSIGVLTSKGFLVKDDTCKRCGIYQVNPTYMWKGDSSQRAGKLKFVLEVQQYNDLDDSQKQRMDDIKRYEQAVKKDNI